MAVPMPRPTSGRRPGTEDDEHHEDDEEDLERAYAFEHFEFDFVAVAVDCGNYRNFPDCNATESRPSKSVVTGF